MLSRFNRLANSEKVQEILSLKCCTSCLKGSRKIASEENCPPPSPNSKANRKPNPDPDLGAIFPGGNFPDIVCKKVIRLNFAQMC